MTFRGHFHPPIHPRVTGFNKQGGEFWIGFIDENDGSGSQIRIELIVPSDASPTKNTFASLHVHHDGVKVIRELEKIGFLKMFEEIQASTFYDVVQCCARCDVPILYLGGEETKEMTPRLIYEELYATKAAEGE